MTFGQSENQLVFDHLKKALLRVSNSSSSDFVSSRQRESVAKRTVIAQGIANLISCKLLQVTTGSRDSSQGL